MPVVAIGKIEDLFAGRGMTRAVHTASDDDGMDEIERGAGRRPTRGLIFANLVDFDTLYGHRNDVGRLRREPRALRRAARRAAAAAARRRPADRHRRSRQRSDDAEHRSLARARAGAASSGAAVRAGVDLGARATFADLGQTLAELFGVGAAGARHQLSRRDPRRDPIVGTHDAFASNSSSASARSWRRRRPRAPTRAAACAPEAEDPIRPAFQRDRDRIIHCKAFRRLKHKTQVFFAPTGDHYRTRLTHTLEVSQIARSIAKVLRLNEELTEAIALGHDLGHTPFGHAGERVLNELIPGGFNHYEQSLRIVDVLENDGAGPEPDVGSARRHRPALEGQERHAGRRRSRASRQHDRRADRARRRHHRLRQPRHRRCGAGGAAAGGGPAARARSTVLGPIVVRAHRPHGHRRRACRRSTAA